MFGLTSPNSENGPVTSRPPRGRTVAFYHPPITYSALMKLRRKSDPAGSGVEVFTTESGTLVQGSKADVSAFVEQMMKTTSGVGINARQVSVDGLAVAANIFAFAETHREYIVFSDRAKSLLEASGAIPTSDGYFRSFVRAGNQFAGNLDWKPSSLGPEQALSLQTAAAQLALRAAIKDVVAAIERVEGKVDQIIKMSQAAQFGAAVADRASLQGIVDRVRSTGFISKTDWSTVGSLGPLITRDLESLRAYILLQLNDVKSSSFTRTRAEEAKDLTEHFMKQSIALLVVVEQNYALWQELRIAHTANYERNALASTTKDVHHQLAALAAADQKLVEVMAGVVERLLTPTGFEGFAPFQKRVLVNVGKELNEATSWFADQRQLTVAQGDDIAYVGISESMAKLSQKVVVGARSASEALSKTTELLRNRPTSDPQAAEPPLPELE